MEHIISGMASVILACVTIFVSIILVLKVRFYEFESEQKGTPGWISRVSWGITIFFSIIGFFMLIPDLQRHYSEPIDIIIASLFSSCINLIIIKLISYGVLVCIDNIWKRFYASAPKTINYIADKSSKTIDDIAVGVVKKAHSIKQRAKEEADREHEKQILKERINDLELQKLKQRVSELEEELKNK